jgi:hypothetical protein
MIDTRLDCEGSEMKWRGAGRVYGAICFGVIGACLGMWLQLGDATPSLARALGAVMGSFAGLVVGSGITALVRRFFDDDSRWSDGLNMGGIFGGCIALFAVAVLRHVGVTIVVTLVAGVGGFICGWFVRDHDHYFGLWRP